MRRENWSERERERKTPSKNLGFKKAKTLTPFLGKNVDVIREKDSGKGPHS